MQQADLPATILSQGVIKQDMLHWLSQSTGGAVPGHG